MARKGEKKDGGASSAPKQTVEGLSEDQRYSLTEQHKNKYLLLMATKTAADTALKNFGKIVKADLGEDGLQDIKDLIQLKTPEGEAAMKAMMERQARVMRWMNIAIGSQGALFAEEDRTPITDRAFAEGKRQGLAGETISNPHHHTTEAHRSHLAGYEAGQATNAAGIKKLDDAPKGSVPREQWQKDLANKNDEVQRALKSGAVDSLASAH
jgi:hypothetical protein